jgi:hypothetical protein
MTSKFRERLNMWGTIVFGTLMLGGGATAVYERWIAPRSAAIQAPPGAPPTTEADRANTVGVSLLQCPESISITACRARDHGLNGASCVVENVAQAPLSGRFLVWSYDGEGILLGDRLLDIDGLMPGQRKRADLASANSHAKRLVVCSLDPQSPAVKAQIRPINQDAAPAPAQPAPVAAAQQAERARPAQVVVNGGATVCADMDSMNQALARTRANSPHASLPEGCVVMQRDVPTRVLRESTPIPDTVIVQAGDTAAMVLRSDLSYR